MLLVPPDPVTTTLELAVSRWLEAALVTAASSATSATPAAPDHRNRGRGKVASTTHEAVRLPPSGSSSWDTRALSLHYSVFTYSHGELFQMFPPDNDGAGRDSHLQQDEAPDHLQVGVQGEAAGPGAVVGAGHLDNGNSTEIDFCFCLLEVKSSLV